MTRWEEEEVCRGVATAAVADGPQCRDSSGQEMRELPPREVARCDAVVEIDRKAWSRRRLSYDYAVALMEEREVS